MRAILKSLESMPRLMVVRYAVNGVAATALHYIVLQINLTILGITSTGIANFIAAIFGISLSYFGSRYFVFRERQQSILQQALKFGVLYLSIAVLHGLFLYIWSDLQRWDYRTGFLIATLMQLLLSFFGNKMLIFKK
jgi:putative flippase GtrA